MPLYKADPNNSKRQIPNIQGDNRYDRAVVPVTCSVHKAPSYVVVNQELTSSVGFFFGGSASFSTKSTLEADTGGAVGGSDLTGSGHYPIILRGPNLNIANLDTTSGTPPGTKLNIHPTAWSGSLADAGKITFVYKSGLATGGF
tara:strand:+ start:224 stop:655 length:432 start_codon:yes stop_codon:yes gene_type:complete